MALATFPDPALVFAAAALDSSLFGAGFVFDVMDRSVGDNGNDVRMKESREPKELLPPIGSDCEPDVQRRLRLPAIDDLAVSERRDM